MICTHTGMDSHFCNCSLFRQQLKTVAEASGRPEPPVRLSCSDSLRRILLQDSKGALFVVHKCVGAKRGGQNRHNYFKITFFMCHAVWLKKLFSLCFFSFFVEITSLDKESPKEKKPDVCFPRN